MSEWGNDIAAIQTLVRTAVDLSSTMPAGTAGAEWGVRSGLDLRTGELPHLFVYNPSASDTELDYQQTETENRYLAELWDDVDQAAMATYRDAIRDAVTADPKLGGLARRFRLVSAELVAVTASENAVRQLMLLEFQVRRME